MVASSDNSECDIGKALQSLFTIPPRSQKSIERLFYTSPCLHHLYYLAKQELAKLSTSAQDEIARCQQDVIHREVCEIAAWLYFHFAPKLIQELLQDEALGCKTGKTKKTKKGFFAALILFLEWRVRPQLYLPIQREIPGARRKGDVETAWAYIRNDQSVLSHYTPLRRWLLQVDSMPRSTYDRYEKAVIECFAQTIFQTFSSYWNEVAQPSPQAQIFLQQRLAYYRGKLEHALQFSDDHPFPLLRRFVPPRLQGDWEYYHYAYSDRHLIVSGPFGSGKTTLLRAIALQQPPNVTVIWAPRHLFQTVSLSWEVVDILSGALQNILGPLGREEEFAWIDQLFRVSQRVFILDSNALPPRKFLQRLQDIGRVILSVQAETFELPERLPGLWDHAHVEPWPIKRLRRLIYKRTQGTDSPPLTETFTKTLIQEIPPYPHWMILAQKVQNHQESEDPVSFYQVMQTWLDEVLTLETSLQRQRYRSELTLIAWRLAHFQDACREATYATRCHKVLQWAISAGLMRRRTENHIEGYEFVHPDILHYLAAQVLLEPRKYIRSDLDGETEKTTDRDDEVEPKSSAIQPWEIRYQRLFGLPGSPHIFGFIFYQLFRQQRWREIREILTAIEGDIQRHPYFLQSITRELAHPIGLIRRLLVLRANAHPDAPCDRSELPLQFRATDSSPGLCEQLDAIYQAFLAALLPSLLKDVVGFCKHPYWEAYEKSLSAHAKLLLALEPLPTHAARQIADFLIQHPNIFQFATIAPLYTPSIRASLEERIVQTKSESQDSDIVNIVFKLASHQAISARTIVTLHQSGQLSQQNMFRALSIKGDEDAARALTFICSSPSRPETINAFDYVRNAWSQSPAYLLPPLMAIYQQARLTDPWRWQRLARNLLCFSRYSTDFFLDADFSKIPTELLAGILLLASTPQASIEVAIQLLDLHYRYSQRLNTHKETPAVRLIRSATLEHLILRSNAILPRLKTKDILFLLQHIPMEPSFQLLLAEDVLLPRLPDPQITALAQQWFHALETDPERKATALILLDCAQPIDEEALPKNHPSIHQALMVRKERCRNMQHDAPEDDKKSPSL